MKLRITKLLFLLIVSTGILAQTPAPGGVSNPEVWVKSKPVNKDLQGSYHWVDYGVDSLKLRNYDSRGPLFGNEFLQVRSKIRTYNFNPGLDLASMGSSKELYLKRTNLSQATIIGVFAPNSYFDKEMLLYGLDGRQGTGSWLSTDKIINSTESNKGAIDYGDEKGSDLIYKLNDSDSNLNKFRERSLKVVSYYQSVPSKVDIWGESKKNVFTFGHVYDKNNVNHTSLYPITATENRAFWGTTPEFIVYNRFLTLLERRKVESYLGSTE